MSRSISSVSSPWSAGFLAKVLTILSMAIAIVAVDSVNAEAEAANPKYAGIVVDARTGNVLYSENADRLQYPASLTKMMTLYMEAPSKIHDADYASPARHPRGGPTSP